MKVAILFLFVLLTVISSSHEQKIVCNKKGANRLDSYITRMLTFGDPKRKFPETMEEMPAHCKTTFRYMDYMKRYTLTCLQNTAKQAMSVLNFASNNLMKKQCNNPKRREEFLVQGRCVNDAKKGITKCYNRYIEGLMGANTVEGKMRLPISCCAFYKMKQCMIKSAEKNKRCTERALQIFEANIDGVTGDVLNLLCTNFDDSSDKCSKIVSPSKPSSKRRPKSFMFPLLDMLSSI